MHPVCVSVIVTFSVCVTSCASVGLCVPVSVLLPAWVCVHVSVALGLSAGLCLTISGLDVFGASVCLCASQSLGITQSLAEKALAGSRDEWPGEGGRGEEKLGRERQTERETGQRCRLRAGEQGASARGSWGGRRGHHGQRE